MSEPIRTDFVIEVERAEDVPGGTLYLKPIPGGLIGETINRELLRSRSGARNLRVSLGTLTARLDTFAQPILSDEFNPGELTTPREMRIARIGTFYEPETLDADCNNYRTGLRTESENVFLVYVDRPGNVHGARYTEPYVIDFRLSFPDAGIYAIALRRQGMVITPRVIVAEDDFQAMVRGVTCRTAATTET